MVVWERVDPRIDRPEDLSQEVGSPTSPASVISQSGVNALMARWTDLAEREPTRIALVPVTADVLADLPKVALRLSNGHDNGSAAPLLTPTCDYVTDGEDLTQPLRVGSPVVVACEVPSADLTALRPIMDCDLVVLVARRGTPRAALRGLLESLTEFGVSPKWAILLSRRAVGLPNEATASGRF
jgi:hypothetical protein